HPERGKIRSFDIEQPLTSHEQVAMFVAQQHERQQIRHITRALMARNRQLDAAANAAEQPPADNAVQAVEGPELHRDAIQLIVMAAVNNSIHPEDLAHRDANRAYEDYEPMMLRR
ncbi:unnamed protein product, partial [marine sediment metagenome]